MPLGSSSWHLSSLEMDGSNTAALRRYSTQHHTLQPHRLFALCLTSSTYLPRFSRRPSTNPWVEGPWCSDSSHGRRKGRIAIQGGTEGCFCRCGVVGRKACLGLGRGRFYFSPWTYIQSTVLRTYIGPFHGCHCIILVYRSRRSSARDCSTDGFTGRKVEKKGVAHGRSVNRRESSPLSLSLSSLHPNHHHQPQGHSSPDAADPSASDQCVDEAQHAVSIPDPLGSVDTVGSSSLIGSSPAIRRPFQSTRPGLLLTTTTTVAVKLVACFLFLSRSSTESRAGLFSAEPVQKWSSQKGSSGSCALAR